MIKAIIWDFDGVIVDSEPVHHQAFAQVAQSLDVTLTLREYVEKYIGYDDRDVFRLLLDVSGNANGGADRVAALCAEKAEVFEQIVNDGVQTIPGAVELITHAAQRMPLGISSGATRRDVDLILRTLDLHSKFEAIVTADDVPRSKPHPQSYLQAVQEVARRRPELTLGAGDCLAIEDTATGIQSARSAGLMTLGLVSTGPAELLHGAHRLVDTLEGLDIDQLQAWFG